MLHPPSAPNSLLHYLRKSSFGGEKLELESHIASIRIMIISSLIIYTSRTKSSHRAIHANNTRSSHFSLVTIIIKPVARGEGGSPRLGKVHLIVQVCLTTV